MVTDAEFQQPDYENTGKRKEITEQGVLVNAGFYGPNDMEAFFKEKAKAETDDEKTKLNRIKQGSSVSAKQYIQIASGTSLSNAEQAFEYKLKADPASDTSEEDSALTFGAAVGALTAAISVLAF